MTKLSRRIVTYVLLVVLALLFLVPVYGIVVNSFKSLKELTVNPWGFPQKLGLDNYDSVWNRKTGGLKYYFLNSFKITLPSVLVVLAASLLMAFPLARYALRANRLLLGFMVFCMMIPHQVMIIPLFKFINAIRLYDTITALVWIHAGYSIPFAVFLFRNYMVQIPMDIQYAAMVDGLNRFQIFGRMILPLAKPAIAVMAILEFTWVFNEFFYGLILTNSQNTTPATVAVAMLKTALFSSQWNYQAAASLILSVPTLVVFLSFQRYFIKGITLGSVKG
jgi:multiple sugar transport system permease protein